MKHWWVCDADGIGEIVQAKDVKSAIQQHMEDVYKSSPSFNPEIDAILRFEVSEVKDIAEFETRLNDGECGPPVDECEVYYATASSITYKCVKDEDDCKHLQLTMKVK